MTKIAISGKNMELEATTGQSIGQLLKENHIFLSEPCSGLGTCGKCRVRVVKGNLEPSEQDVAVISEDEICAGVRLACQAFPVNDIEIELLNQEDDIYVIASGENALADTAALPGRLGIAVDIGTTTLAATLIDIELRQVLAEESMINHQRSYGADVVSRIQASNEGHLESLKESIRSDIRTLCDRLLSNLKVSPDNIEGIAIAGNTTMVHLLMGYPCNGLGVYPFTPYYLGTITGTSDEILGMDIPLPVTIFPGISTYVGGDIVSGLLTLGIDECDDIIALIDLGTNGEMAIGNKNRIMVTSAAAGPAFEGGNISCGMASIPGAVCRVDINQNEVKVCTIRDENPIGICGTGAIELTAELLKNGIIDETGLMDESLGDEGYPFAKLPSGKNICFTQKDVREIQMAKAAVAAGFETLIQKYGTSWDKISKVYVAGGFGYHLNTEKAAFIGLLPEKLLPGIEAAGNTSLKGAMDYLRLSDADERISRIINVSEEISLAKDVLFSDLYINSMMF